MARDLDTEEGWDEMLEESFFNDEDDGSEFDEDAYKEALDEEEYAALLAEHASAKASKAARVAAKEAAGEAIDVSKVFNTYEDVCEYINAHLSPSSKVITDCSILLLCHLHILKASPLLSLKDIPEDAASLMNNLKDKLDLIPADYDNKDFAEFLSKSFAEIN